MTLLVVPRSMPTVLRTFSGRPAGTKGVGMRGSGAAGERPGARVPAGSVCTYQVFRAEAAGGRERGSVPYYRDPGGQRAPPVCVWRIDCVTSYPRGPGVV